MKKANKKLVGALIASAMGVSGTAQAADIVIGVPNWPTVAMTADVLKVVIEDNFGLEVELQNGTNPIIFEAMDSGSMHVHPEVWMPNQVNLNNTYVQEKGTVTMNPNYVGGPQAMCVTADTAKNTGIKALSELADPEMATNFDKDGNGMGDIWIGAPGWASTNIEKIRAKSYGYDTTMDLREMDETLALAEVDAAIAKGENIVFFCYKPHHMFTLYDLVILEEPAADKSKWTLIQPTDDPDWLEKSSAPTAWPVAQLHIHYATSLKDSHPAVASLLHNVALDGDSLSDWAYAIIVDKVDNAEYAKQWVMDNADLVNSWL